MLVPLHSYHVSSMLPVLLMAGKPQSAVSLNTQYDDVQRAAIFSPQTHGHRLNNKETGSRKVAFSLIRFVEEQWSGLRSLGNRSALVR